MDLVQAWFNTNIDFPAVVLVFVFMLLLMLLWKTQHNPTNNFDFSDMLRDDQGKPSHTRLASFICLAMTSWYVMYAAVKTSGKIDTWVFITYITLWSGVPLASKFIDAYAGRLTPGSKDDKGN